MADTTNSTTDEKYKVWWDEENQVGRYTGIGDYDKDTALQITQLESALMDKRAQTTNWLIDLGRNTRYSSEARKLFAEEMKHKYVGRMAFIGASVFLRTVVNFVTAVSGKQDVKHFASEKEALEWLHQQE
jgi:hypothetical protein